MPKTGGTSLCAILKELVHGSGQTYVGLKASAISTLTPSVILQAIQSRQGGAGGIGGHATVLTGEFDWSIERLLRSMGRGYQLRPIVLMRDPILRAASQYQHHVRMRRLGRSPSEMERVFDRVQCSQQTKGEESCRQLQNPSRCAGAGWCGIFQNAQADALAGAAFLSPAERVALRRSSSTLLSAAERNLRAAAFVGVTEAIGESVCLLLASFGWAPTTRRACCTDENCPIQQRGNGGEVVQCGVLQPHGTQFGEWPRRCELPRLVPEEWRRRWFTRQQSEHPTRDSCQQ